MNTEIHSDSVDGIENTECTGTVAGVGSSANTRTRDYVRMQRSLEWLAEHFEHQPTLAEAAAQICMSEFHFQRLFTRWAGVSPKRYVQILTLARAKASLARSHSVMDAALEAGLSGPSRLHDLFVRIDAVTPGEFKSGGAGMRIDCGLHPTPFGDALVAQTERGVCA
ncbi:MAG: helix-turn-helix domain-containing protein, partial [Gammaproteobacteria bacterium]